MYCDDVDEVSFTYTFIVHVSLQPERGSSTR